MHKFPGDLNISGSLISAKQIHLNLQNGTIGTLTEQKHETGISDARNYRIEHSKTDVGSQINTQGDLTVYSGGGVNITQGQINSGQGTVGIAGQNVRITEGRRSGSVDAAVYNKSNLGISSHSVSMHGGESYNQAQGSSITGSRVVVQAQKNLDVRGSNIVSDNQTFLGAGGAVSITAAQNTHNSHRQQRETGSGIMGTGGGILIGSQTEGELNRQSSTGHTLSTIGSTHGRVDIQGKGNVLVSGTEIIAAKADCTQKNMGLTTWKNAPGGRILKSDVIVAKNYLEEKQIRQLERAITGYFDYIEDLIERENTFTMAEFAQSINEFLAFRKYEILRDKGRITKKLAEQKAKEEYDEFNKTQKITSDFDQAVKCMLEKGDASD